MSQKEKKKLVSIKTDDTLMETALHGTHLFPYKLYDDNITDYDFNCIDWHWHTEFEFVYIESGIVHFNVGEDNFDMSEGQGIFIIKCTLCQGHYDFSFSDFYFIFVCCVEASK